MDDYLLSLTKHLENELGILTRVAWLVGSYSIGKFTPESDIDLVVIAHDDSCNSKVKLKTTALSQNLKKEIDITNFSAKDAKKRANFNDYLLASLLEEEKYLFGDEGFLRESKEIIFSKRPTEESVKYNLLEGVHTLDMSFITFDNFRYHLRRAFLKTSPEPKDLAKAVLSDDFRSVKFSIKSEDNDFVTSELYLLQTVRNCGFALAILLRLTNLRPQVKQFLLKILKDKQIQ